MTAIGLSLGLPFARRAESSVAAHPLAEYLAVGSRLIDGSSELARYYTDSAGTTACAVSGTDPVGKVLDLSGSDGTIDQSNSSHKPVYLEASGFKILKTGGISALLPQQHLETTVDLTADFTFYAVYKWYEVLVGANDGIIFAPADGSAKVSVLPYDGWNRLIVIDGNGSSPSVFPAPVKDSGVAGFCGVYRASDVVNLRAASSIGGSVSTNAASSTYTANAVAMGIGKSDGYVGTYAVVELAFMLYSPSDVGSTARTAIEDYINTQFAGGW